MSARDDVLAAVRQALRAGRDASHTHPVPASVGSPASTREVPRGADRAAVLDLFAERVADYRASVTRCAAADLAAAVAAALDGASPTVVPPGLDVEVPGAVVDDGLSTVDLDAVAAVVTAAALGIAETGTIVLDHGPGQGRRVVTLLPDLHVCVVPEDQVVPDVLEALTRLDPNRPQTWVSGPSATSDIELSRVEGVHGPRRLHVVLVAPKAGELGS
jgi:L-lactate dehydrogenase complex protein LldG